MTTQERVMEAAKLRLKFQMNGRLRLESLAALSKVFREYGEPIREELLGSIVFAVPEELLGQADPQAQSAVDISERGGAPATPSNPPRGAPATPSNPPRGAPATPSNPPPARAPATPGNPPPARAPATPGNPPPAQSYSRAGTHNGRKSKAA